MELSKILPALEAIKKIGGKPLIVGGFVRDSILKLPSKDLDIEVYHVNAATLTAVLRAYGKVETVGASYGVIKLWMGGKDYDFTLPRRDNKCGRNHKDFTVEGQLTKLLAGEISL